MFNMRSVLDCSSFLLSASSRCFCNCVSSIFHSSVRSFQILANMLQCNLHFFDFLLLVLFHSLLHLSFIFSVSRQGSLGLSVSHFRRFDTIFFLLSFCPVSSTTASFSAISSSAFSTLLKSVSIQFAFSSRIFALNTAAIDVQRLPEVDKQAFQTSTRRRRHPPSSDLKVPNTCWLEHCTSIADVRVRIPARLNFSFLSDFLSPTA